MARWRSWDGAEKTGSSRGGDTRLAACATPYQAAGIRGGFVENQRAPRQFEVVFYGNGHTNLEAAEDYVRLRAAELTLEQGYAYFTITEDVSYAWEEIVRTPERTHTVISGRLRGETFRGTSETYSTGGLYVTTVNRPKALLLIECYAEAATAASEYYDAAALARQIRAKHGLASVW